MAAVALRREERIGLAVAVVAHAALLLLLIWRPHAPPVVTPPDRIEVTISDQVSLKSTSPEPQAKAAPDIAPEIGAPPPPAPVTAPPVPQVEPRPEPRMTPPPEPVKPRPPKPEVRPEPRPVPKPEPRPVPRPEPRPVPHPVPRPKPRPVPKPVTRPEPPRPVAKPVARPEPRPAAAPAQQRLAKPSAESDPIGARLSEAKKPTTRPGGSRIGADFLKGESAQAEGTSHNSPAATIGPAVRSALSGEITRQLKPHWAAPQGADAEKLVTILAWNLNRDGSLAGTPRVVQQEGITDANRPQAARHAEQAIRAVELAAPFDLPTQYYDAWKHVVAFRFDKRLSQ